jgi:hypothetical protein
MPTPPPAPANIATAKSVFPARPRPDPRRQRRHRQPRPPLRPDQRRRRRRKEYRRPRRPLRRRLRGARRSPHRARGRDRKLRALPLELRRRSRPKVSLQPPHPARPVPQTRRPGGSAGGRRRPRCRPPVLRVHRRAPPQPRPIVRVRETGVAEPTLDAPLATLVRRLAQLADKLEDGRERDEAPGATPAAQGPAGGVSTSGSPSATKGTFTGPSAPAASRPSSRSAAPPIDVAPALRQHLFGCRTSVVCTSATLAMGGQVEPFAARMGADEARAVVVKSPFDYARQMRVYLASDVPLPTAQDARLALDVLADYIAFCASRVRGGSWCCSPVTATCAPSPGISNHASATPAAPSSSRAPISPARS